MTTSELRSLHEILEQEKECCEQLLKVSRGEHESLVKNDIKRLNRETKEMQHAVKRLRRIHEKRRRLLAAITGSSDSQVSIRDLVAGIGDENATQLRDTLTSLIKTGEALYKMNQQTIYLVNFSMGLLDNQINVWADALSEREGYTGDGKNDVSNTDPRLIEGKF